MKKEEFLNLNIESQINYLNNKLLEGQTVIRIREDIGIGEKTLQKIIKKAGYKYLQRERMYAKEPTISTEVSNIKFNDLDDKTPTLRLQENIQEELLKLLSIKEELFDLVIERRQNADKEATSIIEVIQDSGIKIELDNSEVIKKTIRGNKTILDNWDEFCNSNKQFNKQDLLSMALKKYMEQY